MTSAKARESGYELREERHWQRYLHGLFLVLKNPLTLLGLLITVLLIFTALLAPYLAPYPDQGRGASNLEGRLLAPSAEHPFGTDNLGRDILSRVIFGARVSLKAALIVVAIVVLIGSPLGAIAGYYGGKLDEIIMRFADMILAFPSLLLAIAIVAALGPSLTNAMIAVSVPWWPWYTRLVRGQVVSLRERQFVEAARAAGASDKRIIFRHILPNTLSPVIVQATLDMGYVILATSGLGFLGLGTQPPTADWGVMVSAGREYILNQWWISTFPGLAIFVTVLGFNLLGDGIREFLDPKLRWKTRK
jgi:peptide/nickel transport system permease protein